MTRAPGGPSARAPHPGLRKSFGTSSSSTASTSRSRARGRLPHRRIGLGQVDLLRCVNLLEPVDAGRIEVGGEEITAPGVDVDRVRRRIGIVFQSFNLFPHLRVLDNVTLGAAPRPRPKRGEAEAAAIELLRRFGLEDKQRRVPRTGCPAASSNASRSSGRWRCSRASCCSTRSPARSTRSWSPRCSTSSASCAAGGMTMVIATHEMGFARDVADRVAFLDGGRILEIGPPERSSASPREPRTQQFLQRVIAAGRLQAWGRSA